MQYCQIIFMSLQKPILYLATKQDTQTPKFLLMLAVELVNDLVHLT